MSSKIELNYDELNPILTFDTDWAPDYTIDYVSEKLQKLKIKATWFITHESPAIQRLKENSLFEIGIHPNFYSNSTQGKDIDEILKNLKRIAPNAKSIRTHGLLQSTEILLKFHKYGIETDVSILLNNEESLKPHHSKPFKILRIPYYWEDDVEMMYESNWENVDNHFSVQGLKIFDFHPIHIFLNSDSMEKYNELKTQGYPKISKEKLLEFRNKNVGTDTFFEQFIEKLSRKRTHTINEITQKFYESIEK